MHISRMPKPEEVKVLSLYEHFNKTSSQQKIPFSYVKKKINIAEHSYIPWAHETFAK